MVRWLAEEEQDSPEMVLIRQRAPASPGHPLTHTPAATPAQQGLEDAELPGSFPDQASPAYFWEAGRIVPGRAG